MARRYTAALEKKLPAGLRSFRRTHKLISHSPSARFLPWGVTPIADDLHHKVKADHAAIDSAATYCDITHLLDRAINTLSGGERQRVLIARSLVAEAEFILLDEPTANLDVEHALDVLELCKTLSHKGKTIIVATHDFNLVTRYATRLILLQAGKLIAQGDQETVLSREAIQEVFQVDAEVVPTKAGPPVYVFHQRSGPRPQPISPGPVP